MIKIFTLIIAFSLPLKGMAHSLGLMLSKTRKIEGTIYVAVYDKASQFPKGTLFSEAKIVVSGESEVELFLDLPAGQYAISAFLDANGNGKLDTNMFGIPTERFGFSNNPRILTGAPSFLDCAFQVTGDTKLDIKLITLTDQ